MLAGLVGPIENCGCVGCCHRCCRCLLWIVDIDGFLEKIIFKNLSIHLKLLIKYFTLNEKRIIKGKLSHNPKGSYEKCHRWRGRYGNYGHRLVNGLFEITKTLIPEERKYPSISGFLVLFQALECGGDLSARPRFRL